ncbi:molecular chaperone [Sporanaerobium hydrogeniformans]|uniref:Molecular chaperone n=1 Tax=Sporanaerobium hydrogeniformans TaxID=3072179 RepID=A0AC61D6E9_9FIRM|nr:polyphosphate polymerase domain-containing protein [Sporanaerobium hydrogeniformans]PHV69270.1 molecular chaperone [Sporanaerobium hydrogeniformans]
MVFRHEIKHLINEADYLAISKRLKFIAHVDKNAREGKDYKIRSLYFDNYSDKALNEKLLGINNREKFRLRYYNDDTSFIRLEKKSKYNGLCSKVSTFISKEKCNLLIEGEIDFLKESTEPLFNELYVKMKTQLIKPKTIVDYVRQAYIYEPGNVRITFDKSIKTGLFAVDFLNTEKLTVETLDKRYIILEVKYDAFLPQIIADCIQTNERRATAFSKYAVCRMYG